MASGPVHMPANSPAPSATANVASHEEHASALSHEEHAVASTHEAKKEFYTVKMTDTYKKIAETHHVTVAELKTANHIKANTLLRTGQKLVIPSSKTMVAKSGASHDTSTTSLSASPMGSAKLHRHYYTVTKGDTLKYIAKKFDVTPSALEKANNLSGTKVAVGEKLRIPSHDTHNTASASASSPVLTDHVAAPVMIPAPAPAPIQPSQVETQPAPVEQPALTPSAAPVLEPQPTPASSPELTSLNF
jgi:LysM repeat protein